MIAALETVVDGLEIVWIDDGSTDDTPEVAARYGERIRYHRQENAGLSAARNTGLREARYELVVFLDADDLWLPERLACQLPVAAADPTAAVTGGWENFLSPDVEPATSRTSLFAAGLQTAPIAGTLLIAKNRFLDVGFFDESLWAGEFIDWVLRARQAGVQFSAVPELILRRRIHATNHTRQKSMRNRSFFDLIRKHHESTASPAEGSTP
jgi:glycosyltransferase involved in cell wall biosynthesis